MEEWRKAVEELQKKAREIADEAMKALEALKPTTTPSRPSQPGRPTPRPLSELRGTRIPG